MRRKTDEHKRKGRQQDVPSTGRGAASAMDALIKRRIAPPENNNLPQPPRPRKH
jgi:hypothetical protein